MGEIITLLEIGEYAICIIDLGGEMPLAGIAGQMVALA